MKTEAHPMLRWQFQPDEAFCAILDRSLSISIDGLSDHLAGTMADQDDLSPFGSRTSALFDARQLHAECRKLLRAHRTSKLYMPTDYHFLILHDILNRQISNHNDGVSRRGEPMEFGNALLAHIDFDFVMFYFWDEDFLFDPKAVGHLSEEDKTTLAFNDELFDLVQDLKPHTKELELKEVQEQPCHPQASTSEEKATPIPKSTGNKLLSTYIPSSGKRGFHNIITAFPHQASTYNLRPADAELSAGRVTG